MTGEEMERAIEFLLQNQATLEERLARTQSQLSDTQAQIAATQAQLSATQTQVAATQTQVAELTSVVRMQADSQSQLNQTLTTAIIALAGAQQKTEAKVDRLAGVVERLVERLSP